MNRVFPEWVTNLFQRNEPVTRSSKDGESLTEYESKYIHRTYHCPDCGGVLLVGPGGGCSINCCCKHCNSEFNLTFMEDTVWGERISDAGPRDAGKRLPLYRGTVHEAAGTH